MFAISKPEPQGVAVPRYSRRLVVIHWLTLLLLPVVMVLGGRAADLREAGVASISAYQAHMAAGVLVLAVTLWRLYARWRDGAPPPVGSPWMRVLAKLTHGLLYLVVLALALSGMATAAGGGVTAAVLAGNAQGLPADFANVLAYGVHTVLVALLLGLVGLHVLAALKHQFIDQDGLLRRMGLGGRSQRGR